MDTSIASNKRTARKLPLVVNDDHRSERVRRILLLCGLVSSLFYLAINIFVPLRFSGYSFFSQTVSELSAIGTPTRTLWVLLGTVYTLLVAAFGLGVWESAGGKRSLSIVGCLM